MVSHEERGNAPVRAEGADLGQRGRPHHPLELHDPGAGGIAGGELATLASAADSRAPAPVEHDGAGAAEGGPRRPLCSVKSEALHQSNDPARMER